MRVGLQVGENMKNQSRKRLWKRNLSRYKQGMYPGKDGGVFCQEIPFKRCLLMIHSSFTGYLVFIYGGLPTIQCSEEYDHHLRFVTNNPEMSHKVFVDLSH